MSILILISIERRAPMRRDDGSEGVKMVTIVAILVIVVLGFATLSYFYKTEDAKTTTNTGTPTVIQVEPQKVNTGT